MQGSKEARRGRGQDQKRYRTGSARPSRAAWWEWGWLS